MSLDKITKYLGNEADSLLNHTSKTFDKKTLHKTGPNLVEDLYNQTNRNIQTLRSIQTLYNNGRLSGSGYISILPVDQGGGINAGGLMGVARPGQAGPSTWAAG